MVPYGTEMIRRRKDRAGALEFGKFVRHLRRAKGWTVRKLARVTNIPHATWSRGERGLLDLRKWDYIISVAQSLGIPEEELAKRAVMGRPRLVPSFVKRAGPSGPAVVQIMADAGTLEKLASALPEFRDTLTALLLQSSKTGDMTPLREVAAYAKGLLANSGGRKTRKPAPLRNEQT